MFEHLEQLQPLRVNLLNYLQLLPALASADIREQWPLAPDEYFIFMEERGFGIIKEYENTLPLIIINSSLVNADKDYYGDSQIYQDGPCEPGAKGVVWLFGTDSTGTAFGFDSGDEWR
jgi:hypothetical protein